MAGRKCTICNHPKRNEIDKSLAVDGAVLRTIAVQYRVSKDSLKRHVDNGHIAAKIAKAVHAHEAVEADNLLSEIQEIEGITKDIIHECRAEGNNRDAIAALTRREKQIELKGRVLGSFAADKIKVGGIEGAPVKTETKLNVSEEVKKYARLLNNVTIPE